MSLETYEWLKSNVLAGFSNERPPWWSQGHEDCLYPGAVPMEDVERLLTSWQPEPFEIFDADMHKIDSHMGLRASDTREVMTIMSSTYVPHLYGPWLTETVQTVVGDDAQVSSAGLLRKRCQAWVQIERPQVSMAAGGVTFAPYVLLSTSLDASIATQMNQSVTNTICDNTMAIGRTEGLGAKVKHTRNSLGKLGKFRQVLELLIQGETEFTQYVNDLLDDSVDDHQFSRFVEAYVPIDEAWSEAKKTRAQRKRQDITQLYKVDERAASWHGTAWGVLQAVNTWDNHERQLRNTTGKDMTDTDLRVMLNYDRMVAGKPVSDDAGTLKVLAGVS